MIVPCEVMDARPRAGGRISLAQLTIDDYR